MSQFLSNNEPLVRLSSFVLVLLILAVLELLFPRRKLSYTRLRRWSSNLGISIFNTLILRLLVPLAAISIALEKAGSGQGLLQWLELPTALSIVLFMLIFDMVIYWQHRLFHIIPWLWRLHRMHHTDPDIDFTTANRFHPLEILISAFIKIGLVILLGPPALAVLLAEVILNLSAMFNHSNIRIPAAIDNLLRKVIVTPDMHRVHHSVLRQEHDRNFGFNLSWWDYLFRSYRAQPEKGHEQMDIGINGFRNIASTSLPAMLVQPLKKGATVTESE